MLLEEIKLTESPSNPEDGEEVVSVDAAEIDDIVSRFESIDRLDLPELYILAHAAKAQET